MRAYYDADSLPELPRWRRLHPEPNDCMRFQSPNMKRVSLLLIFVTLLATAGCVYRASISQGNLIKQEDLDQVEVGMTRNQIRFLLGTPLVDDPFHTGRWDYVYYLKVGRREADFTRWVSIFFEDDRVSEIHKDQELDPSL